MKRFLYFPVLFTAFVAPSFATVSLGTAETFAVLGASTVTNTGVTDIKGNLGVSPGTAVVGFPPGILLVGAIHAADAVAAQAQADAATAYSAVAALPCKFNMTGTDLGGLTLTPGVYCFDSTAQLTGALVLDFQSNPNAMFAFQVGSAFTSASNSTVSLLHCTLHCPIYWQVGSSATLGTATKFSGNILALASITLTTNVYLCGRALAQTGAVTMDTNKVYFMGILTLPPPAVEVTGSGNIAVPSPNLGPANASGSGIASFAFQPDSTGEGRLLEYTNHVTGARILGVVNEVSVLSSHFDGSPMNIQLSGTCYASSPGCSFVAAITKSDLPGVADQFGIAFTGMTAESRTPRAVSSGAILVR